MPKKIDLTSPCGTFNFLRPQLAKGSHKGKDVLGKIQGSAQWVGEMKLDGHRMLVSSTCAWSRIGKDIANMNHIQKECPSGTLLDGEILPKSGVEGSDRVSNLRAEDPMSLGFVAFDILYHEGQYVGDMPWSKRRLILESVINDSMDHISLSQLYYMNEWSTEQLMEIASDRGHEGIMLKKTTEPYKANSRSAWVKHKFTDTHDVVIVDCNAKPSEWRVRPGEVGTDGKLYPEGLHTDPWLKGYVGLNYGFYDQQGNLRIVGSLGETGPREDMEQYVGRVAEIKAYGQYVTGALRHPVLERWREDKLPEDCVFEF
jgi:ATP-dependent DNA ligase